jgi:hypothetical protein
MPPGSPTSVNRRQLGMSIQQLQTTTPWLIVVVSA